MRIAYVCTDPGIPLHGRKGASVHVAEVIRALRRRGHDVEVFTPRVDEDAVPADLTDLVVHRLAPITGDQATREQAMLAGNAVLRERLDATGPWDLVYERYSLMSHAAGGSATAHRVPFVVEVNAPLVDEQAAHRHLAHRDLAEAHTRRLFSHATSIIAVSEPVAAWSRARCRHPERVHVVANGVDPTRFTPRGHSDPGEPATIGFVGTLKPWHGVDVLVEATARVAAATACRLRIVGDGPQRPTLDDAVRRFGLAPVTTFTGSVAPDMIPDELARMDIATAPQVSGGGDYFSPMKVFEYQAAGLPVVASATGQLADIVHHGVDGLCTRPGDVADLATALHRLATDGRLRHALGRAGRDWVTTHRTWDMVVDHILTTAEMPATLSAGATASLSAGQPAVVTAEGA